MKSDEDVQGAREDSRAADGRVLLPYRSAPGPLGGEPLSRGKRWLVVLFFVPPVAYVALRVVWWAVNRG